ncbi:hypothetical protein D3C73_1124250 [compost metagenome]
MHIRQREPVQLNREPLLEQDSEPEGRHREAQIRDEGSGLVREAVHLGTIVDSPRNGDQQRNKPGSAHQNKSVGDTRPEQIGYGNMVFEGVA